MKLKKYLYIFSYISFIFIVSMLNACSIMDILSIRLNILLVSNPLYFLLLDGIVLGLIMKKLKKEPYKLQERVVYYLKTMNNLILFIIMYFATAGNIFSVITNLISNIILVYFLRPMTVDPNQRNGVEEYFNKYPEKIHHRFYKDMDEIKIEYNPLKVELEAEIPASNVKVKDEQKEKTRKILMATIPIIVITLIIIGIIFSTIEILKTFSRAQYNIFEVSLNDNEINIEYSEEYHNIIIPIFFEPKEQEYFYSDTENYLSENTIPKTDKYILYLKEFQCINNERGKNIRVSCGSNALKEAPHEVILTKNKMKIYLNDKLIYDGEYKKDITEYLSKTGTYKFEISNKRDKIKTNISFSMTIQ